jgi:hypothetical protein
VRCVVDADDLVAASAAAPMRFSGGQMGDKKRRKQTFLAAHPICCFCGGDTPANTEDHVPARGIFDGRQWPEGYSFPACEPCNGATWHDEKVVAMLARLLNFDDNTTELQNYETRRAMDAVRQAFPEAYPAMRLRPNEVRNFFKRTGRSREGFETQPIFRSYQSASRISCRRCGRSPPNCSARCTTKHTGRVVPSSGVIITKFYSNVQVFDGKIPPDVLTRLI